MWSQIASALLGVWLMAAPTVLGYGPPTRANDHIVGPMATSLAIIAIWETTRPLRWVNVGLGLWLLSAPWVLAYGEWIPTGNSLLAGLLLVTFGLVRGQFKHAYGGGWRSLLGPGELPKGNIDARS